jgi:hypothetical protein
VLLTWIAVLAAAGLFLSILIALDVGRRFGLARLATDPEGLEKGSGPAEGAVFGLLALLIAFTFSGAASRFEGRRQLLTEEANAIGAAYLRLDLLPEDVQPALRELFRRYTEVRSMTYRSSADFALTSERLAEGAALRKRIWTETVAAFQGPEPPPPAAPMVIPALNTMFDIATTRAMATRNHPPVIVFLLLFGISLVGALLVGYGTAVNKRRRWFHRLVFAAMLSLTVCVIVDLELPYVGLIRVDSGEQVLVELRQRME